MLIYRLNKILFVNKMSNHVLPSEVSNFLSDIFSDSIARNGGVAYATFHPLPATSKWTTGLWSTRSWSATERTDGLLWCSLGFAILMYFTAKLINQSFLKVSVLHLCISANMNTNNTFTKTLIKLILRPLPDWLCNWPIVFAHTKPKTVLFAKQLEPSSIVLHDNTFLCLCAFNVLASQLNPLPSRTIPL